MSGLGACRVPHGSDCAFGDLDTLVGVRAELAAGDLRPLYLAWLAGYGTWERDECAFDYDEERRTANHRFPPVWALSPRRSGPLPVSSASTPTCLRSWPRLVHL